MTDLLHKLLVAALLLALAGASGAQASPRALSAFIENRGQWPAATLFALAGGGLSARLEARGFAVALREPDRVGVVRFVFEGASAQACLEGEGPTPTEVRFSLGRAGGLRSRTAPSFARALWREAYPSVDVLYHAAPRGGGGLEYDLRLRPGADLSGITVLCEGAEALSLEPDGSLRVETVLGSLRQTLPAAWQVLPSGERRPVEARIRPLGGLRFGFAAEGIDPVLETVIDPVIEGVAAFGGTGDERPLDVAEDGQGNIVVAGWTSSLDFPATAGAFEPEIAGARDGFLLRLDGSTRDILSATYFGGSGNDVPTAMAIDRKGRIVVVGCTGSADFPVTDGPEFAGGAAAADWPEAWDAFVALFDSAGASLEVARYLGGSGNEWAGAAAVDPLGRIVLAGFTSSFDLPTTEGSFQSAFGGGANDMFIARLLPDDLAEPEYMTYLGGTNNEVSQILLIQGAFQPLDYLNPFLTWPGLAVDADGEVVVGLGTKSPEFPRTPGAFGTAPTTEHREVAVAKLRLDASLAPEEQLLFSAVFGGEYDEAATDVAVGDDGTIWVSGWTFSPGFLAKGDPLPSTLAGDGMSTFVTHIDPALEGEEQLRYSSRLGGSGQSYSMTLGADGTLHLGGVTYSPGGWTAAGPALASQFQGGAQDGYVAVLDVSTPTPQVLYSTYAGGQRDDEVVRVRETASGKALVLGRTSSPQLAGFGETGSSGDAQGFVVLLDLRRPKAAIQVIGPDAGGNVQVDASGSSAPVDMEPLTYAWDFGDGETATGATPSAHPYAPGVHAIRLTVTGATGLPAEASATVVVSCGSLDVGPWTRSDIGSPLLPGGARLEAGGAGEEGSCLALCAGGTGIAGATDEALFVHREVAGDFVLTARLAGLEGGGAAAQAGLMVREGPASPEEALAPGARHASLIFRKGAALSLASIVRDGAGGRTSSRTLQGSGAWVRLERRGGEILGFRSEDGATWTLLDAPLLEGMGASSLMAVGIAASARASSALESYDAVEARLCDVTLETAGGEGAKFVRADSDASGAVEITDAIYTLGHLFLGGEAPACLDAADANDSGTVDLSDAVFTLGYLFLGGPAPPEPFPGCGTDPAPGLAGDALGCAASGC